jgi:hypothetical protein
VLKCPCSSSTLKRIFYGPSLLPLQASHARAHISTRTSVATSLFSLFPFPFPSSLFSPLCLFFFFFFSFPPNDSGLNSRSPGSENQQLILASNRSLCACHHVPHPGIPGRFLQGSRKRREHDLAHLRHFCFGSLRAKKEKEHDGKKTPFRSTCVILTIPPFHL